MKKSLILGILGLAMGVATSYGQGQITLDTYLSSSYGSEITYSPSLGGGNVTGGLYVGLYYGPANSDISGSVVADPTGTALPTDLNAQFLLGSGDGAVVNGWVNGLFYNQLNGGSSSSFQIQASGATQNFYTLMVVVYDNVLGYDQSSIRGHSSAFYMQAGNTTVAGSGDVGVGGMQPFSVYAVPEPSTLALAGLGGFGMLMAFRRKKA